MRRGKLIEYVVRRSGVRPAHWPREARVGRRRGALEGWESRSRLDQIEAENGFLGLILKRALTPDEQSAYFLFLLAPPRRRIEALRELWQCSRSQVYRRLAVIEGKIVRELGREGEKMEW
jgi:hypothetical protein